MKATDFAEFNRYLTNAQRSIETAQMFIARLVMEVSGPSDPPEVGTDPPTGVTDSPPVVSIDPHGVINGHSLAADADGFATVPSWSDGSRMRARIAAFEARSKVTVPAAKRADIYRKLPKRLRTRSVRDNCRHPTREAWMCCNADLGARRAADPGSGLGGNPFSHDAFLWSVTPKPAAPEIDWNIAPETQDTVQYDYHRGDLLTPESGRCAWSSNYDPAQDVEYFNKLYDARIDAELAPLDPNDTPVD